MKTKILLTLSLLFLAGLLRAQHIHSDILTQPWSARWIAVPNQPAKDYGVYHFRKSFELPEKPQSFVVHVSADNRYKLYVNGQFVSLGPARGDLFHWNFETLDLAPYLKPGKNTLAAIVWNFGRETPIAQMSLRTAFIIQGNTQKEKVVNTDKTWKSIRNESYQPLSPQLIHTYYVAGPGDNLNCQQYPWGWETTDFNDNSWQNPHVLAEGMPKGGNWTGEWLLVPRSIPQMELTPQRLTAVREITGDKITVPKDFPAQKVAFTIPARTKVSLLLDQSFLTNAYPFVQFSDGAGATIRLSYAEALYVNEGDKKDWREQHKKGNRNEVAGKRFVGVTDQITADGGKNRTFQSLWFRTYRYVKLDVQTADQPLILEDLYGVFTGYPFQQKARFNAQNPEMDKILEVGWRTARLCAGETYFDCPYYEQLQYAGDTRIQALVSLYNSGDDQLVRNAITQLNYSRLAEGITQSRYPSQVPQEIPPFSLWWIGMVHDYWMYRPDAAFAKSMLPGTRQVLEFFRNLQYMDGSLKKVPYWNFTDWAESWQMGRAPATPEGHSAALDLQLLWAFQLAAELEVNLGMQAYADIYQKEVDKLKQSVRQQYWDEGKKLFADTPEKREYSQHTNTLAVLAGLVTGEEARQLVERTLSDKSLTQATIYFRYYLHQAVVKVGLGDQYLNMLGDWRKQLANGLTTWAEVSDVNTARSDCHAWGSSPNIEFYRTVLGINTDAPGFAKVLVQPHLGNLKSASGSIPHPRGEIAVNYKVDKKGKLMAEVNLPAGVTGRFLWNGKEYPLNGGEPNRLALATEQNLTGMK